MVAWQFSNRYMTTVTGVLTLLHSENGEKLHSVSEYFEYLTVICGRYCNQFSTSERVMLNGLFLILQQNNFSKFSDY